MPKLVAFSVCRREKEPDPKLIATATRSYFQRGGKKTYNPSENVLWFNYITEHRGHSGWRNSDEFINFNCTIKISQYFFDTVRTLHKFEGHFSQ